MKSTTIIVVFALAGLSLVGAYFALSRTEFTSTIERGAPFVIGLSDKAASVRRIEIDRSGKQIELIKQGETWTLASSDGYPAHFETIKSLVSGLENLKVDDRMTALADRHEKLALAWPDDSGRGARVRLYGDAEQPLYDLVLGEERGSPRAQFVRRMGEDQCWRVLGSVSADVEAQRWLDAELLSIPDGEVRGVLFNGLELRGIEGADGKVTYAVVDQAPLAPAGSVEWTEPRLAVAVRSLPSWLSRLEMMDVRKSTNTAADPTISPTFDMVRGTLTVHAVRESDAVWISFSATPKAGAPSAEAINAKKKYSGDPCIPDWTEFSAKHAGWEFKLPEWKLTALEEAAKMPDDGVVEEDPNRPTRVPRPSGG